MLLVHLDTIIVCLQVFMMPQLLSDYRKFLYLGILFVCLILLTWHYNRNTKPLYDVFGYYLYLPAITHINDIKLRDYNKVEEVYHKLGGDVVYQIYKAPGTENNVIMYPLGLSLAYSPAYFSAYAISSILGIDHEFGTNQIYVKAVVYWSYICVFIGLFFLFKFLVKYVEEKYALITLIILSFGTNLLLHGFMNGQAMMSHSYLFMYYALLLLYTKSLIDEFSETKLTIIFIVMALIAVTRNSEIFCIFLPAGMLWYHWPKMKSEILVIKNLKTLTPGLIILSLQIIYWKVVTGHFIYNSYQGNNGQALELFNPYVLEVLFSFRKGLFIYTPMAIFFVVGFWSLYRHCREWFWPTVIFTFLNLWIICSWTCWWYADSFGQRAIIPMYAVWSLGLALFFQHFKQLGFLFKLITIGSIACFTVLNIFQIWQINKGILPTDYISTPFYFSTFGQIHPISEQQRSLMLEDDKSVMKDSLPDFYKDRVEYESSYHVDANSLNPFQHLDASVVVSPEHEFSQGIVLSNRYFNQSEYKWIKLSYTCKAKVDTTGVELNLVAERQRKGKSFAWKCKSAKDILWKKDSAIVISTWYKVPQVERDNDVFRSYLWSMSKIPIEITGIQYELYKSKKNSKIFLF